MPTLDTTSSASGTSLSHTCTGTNLALYVCVYNYDAGTQPSVPTCTYDSTPMTQVETLNFGVSPVEERITVFRLENPSTGSNTVSVTNPVTPNETITFAMSTTDTLQSGSAGTAVTDNTTGLTTQAVVTSTTDDLVVSFISVYSKTVTVGGGETEQLNTQYATQRVYIATEVATGASTTMDFDIDSGSDTLGHIAFAIKDYVAGGSILPQIMHHRRLTEVS